MNEVGLQSERTALAWQRTGLAMFGLGVVVPRFGWPVLGGWSVVPAVVVVAAAIGLALAGRRRAAAARTTRIADGRLPLLAGATAVLLGLVAAVVLVGHVGGRA